MLDPLSSFIRDNWGDISFPLQGLIIGFYFFEQDSEIFFKNKAYFKVRKTCCFLRQVFCCICGDWLGISGRAGKQPWVFQNHSCGRGGL